MFKRIVTSLLLPRPGRTITLPDDGGVVADPSLYDADSTTVLASSHYVAAFEHKYKATFIVPLEHFDYAGVGKNEPDSAMVRGRDLIATLDESLQGKVRIDFMQPRNRDSSKKSEDTMVAQLTFTRPKSATYFKLLLG